jgi:hypothetical protein
VAKRTFNQDEVDFVAEKGKTLGYQSKAMLEAFNAKFPAITYNSLRNLGLRVKMGNVTATAPDVAAIPVEPSIEKVSKEEQSKIRSEFDRKLLAKLKRERAYNDMIIDAITASASEVPDIEIPVLPVKTVGDEHSEQTAVLLFSDLHVGAIVDVEETGGLGQYNYPIFRKRLHLLGDAIESITNDYHRIAHPVKNLVVLSLGDIIEGVTIFASQRDSADDLTVQVLNAMTDISDFFLRLLQSYEHVSVVAVSGNHGRIGRKGEFLHHVNWDFIIMQALKRQFEMSAQAGRISFEVPKSPFAVVDIEGFTFLLRHGDGIKGWGGLPWYGIQRSTGRWIAIQDYLGKHFDYLAMGHFHQRADLPFTGGEVLMNGSFVGTSQFSVEVLETVSPPEQIFGFVHPKHGLGARYPVQLAPKRKGN